MNAGPGTMTWRPGASRLAVEERSRVLGEIRRFFAQRGVLEVETPVIGCSAVSNPNIRNIRVDVSRQAYLRTSPEYAMKRMLAAGYGDMYELGRVFRAGEKGRMHNPEFTMLEWYRVGMAYLDLADEVIELVRCCARGAIDAWQVQRLSYRE